MRRLAAYFAVSAVLLAGCGESTRQPTQASTSPQAIPAALIRIPPQSAVRPEGAVPQAPPRFALPGGNIRISVNGLHFIEGFEGWGSCPYWDAYGGVWTRGYGETEGIGRGSSCIGRAFGEANLRYRIERFYGWAIRGMGVAFNQNQADALYSFAWNLGAGIFRGSLRSALQHRQFVTAGNIMLGYSHAGGQFLPGLYRRRVAERALLLRPGAPAETAAQRRVRLHRQLGNEVAYRERVRGYLTHHRCRKAAGPRPRPIPRNRNQKVRCAVVAIHGRQVKQRIHLLQRQGAR